MSRRFPLGALFALLPLSLAASAETTDAGAPDFTSYALVIGSQRAGEGQQELRFAQDDARRIQSVLTEIGGYDSERVQLLLEPGAAELEQALNRLEARLRDHAARDERSVFLFYYSGHARASGLSLGADELPLNRLKDRLEALPATVRVVILDACQSGAISQVKGVQPAASFSVNSVAGLNTAGMAVLASSTGSELSQESEDIGGSFFTHHLVSGLRGAADEDADGRITLSEAYRYAYNRTLVSTAATAVGRQHVTLGTDLRGKGEMVLTYPSRASARLELPAELAAEVLVHAEPSEVVLAEVFKAEGSAVRLALPPGEYGAVVRRDERFDRCSLSLEDGKTVTLDLGECQQIEAPAVTAKLASAVYVPTVSAEFAFGGFMGLNDEYNERLEDFGFDPGLWGGSGMHFHASLLYHIDANFAVALSYSTLDRGEYRRDAFSRDEVRREDRFDWTAHRIGLELRAGLPLLDGWLTPYLQAGGGATIATSKIDIAEGESQQETHWGWHISVAAGLQFMPWRHLGMFGQAGYVFAPSLENEQGDQHNSGGFGLMLGIRGAY